MYFIYICTASELRLSISPRGTQIKKIDAGIIFTCVVDNSSVDTPDTQQLPVSAEMRWVGPDLQYVSSAKGSRYVTYTYSISQYGTTLSPPKK